MATPKSGPGSFPWSSCVAKMKASGKSDEDANKICAAIKNRSVAKSLELGLAKTEDEAIELIAKKMTEDPLYNYAWSKFVELAEQETSSIVAAENALSEVTKSEGYSSLRPSQKIVKLVNTLIEKQKHKAAPKAPSDKQNLERCTVCGEMVPADQMDQHMQQMHPGQMM